MFISPFLPTLTTARSAPLARHPRPPPQPNSSTPDFEAHGLAVELQPEMLKGEAGIPDRLRLSDDEYFLPLFTRVFADRSRYFIFTSSV